MPDLPEWKPEYSVNNELIDFQHQYLFSLCKTLHQLQGNKRNKLSIEQAISGLLDYIELHFSEEEKLYKRHPEFAAHQKLHQNLIQQTEQLVADYKEEKLELSELLDFVYDWIIEHITKIDSRYFKELENM